MARLTPRRGRREKLLLVYEADGTVEELATNAKPVVAAAYECLGLVAYDKPGQVISLTDVPLEAPGWLRENLRPFYERPAP